ncbi:hypothetical protein LX36DRAFT_583382 [Colletotrichum falcatum]|nr:hypothetical protein LX36DRAFT_583382 [Colletotrichum falcatum]
MENGGRHPSQRARGREHIPLYPKGFIALRIVQLAIASIATGLCAFGVYLLPTPGNCLMIFVSVSTLVVTVWLVVAEFSSPKAYNYWAVLALDIFLLLFWLFAFALLAAEVAFWFDFGVDYLSYHYGSSLGDYAFVFASCMAAASGLGGIQFALFITSLSIHGVMLHRHRRAGLHCSPVHLLPAPATTTGGGLVPEKNGVHVTANQTFQPTPNQAHAHVQAHVQAAPPYVHQDANYANQAAPQQQFQQQQVSAPQPPFTPPPVQAQQQGHYPPTLLSPTHTGAPFPQAQTELSAAAPMPKLHEAPANVYHPQ